MPRYAPNQTPDSVPSNDFFGSEFYRIKEALRNIEADGLTIYKGSPAKVAFNVDPSGILVTDTVAASPYVKFFNNLGVQTGWINSQNTLMQIEQLNGNSGTVSLYAKDAGGTRRELSWLPAGGTSGGLLQMLGKNVIEAGDTQWLYLNRASTFTSGVKTPLVLEADGGVDLGSGAGKLRLGSGKGSINTTDAVGSRYGYQANGRMGFLSDGSTAFEIYDITNSKIMFGGTQGAESSMYHNGTQTAKTQASDFQVHDGTAFRSVFKGTRFFSSQQTNATSGSVAHGLGVLPTFFQAVLVCVTAEKSYSVGDEVDLLSAEGSSGQFPAVWADATNIGWAMVQTNPFIVSKGTTTNSAITAANWKIVLKAWKFY